MEEKILGKNSLLELLTELENIRSDEQDILSAYIAPNSSLSEVPEKLREKIERIKSVTGLVIFSWEKEGKKFIILPPFPVQKDEIFYDNFFKTEQLREILTKDYTLGIILLRLGEYAVGIFEGNKLIESKCDKRLVIARQKKGGSSQGRFRRIREVQVERFFDEVYEILRKKFEPHIGKIDYVFFGGTGITIKNFLKRNSFLKKISEKKVEKILNVREINKKSLENILKEVWKTKVFLI
jgi:peptide subunit release factor 1 (eRF1)